MTTPWPSSRTPYVVPDGNFLNSWPTGIDFTSIPPERTATTAQKEAALSNVCLAASSMVDGYLNFPLHAVLNTETLDGPNYRVTVRNSTGEGRMILSRWPITNIVSVQVAQAGVYPRQWTTVPSGFWHPEYPVISRYNSSTPGGSGEGGQAIIIAPGYVNWCGGRWGQSIQATYYHGWPHTHLTQAASAGDTSIHVGDVTAWAPFTAGQPGAEGIVYDITGGQETLSVTAASATTGAGTLTLSSALNFAHPANVMVSSLPSDAIWAAALFAAAQALTRGATATATQTQPGRGTVSSRHAALCEQAEEKLSRFRRVI